ncbi:MAG: NUDIX hydrolase [archaeon]
MINKEGFNQPHIAVDLIIKYKEGIVIIERKNPPLGFALPGGFVDYGETLEQAAIREAKEETNLDVTIIRQLHAYSDPKRDPRFHVISVAYILEGNGTLKAQDDAKSAKVMKGEDIPKLVCDQNQIINDAMNFL